MKNKKETKPIRRFLKEDLFPAFIALMLFRPYTYMERWVEISFGLISWCHVLLTIWAIAS